MNNGSISRKSPGKPGGFWTQQQNTGFRGKNMDSATWNLRDPQDTQGRWPAGRRDESSHTQTAQSQHHTVLNSYTHESVQGERAE